MDTPSKYTTAKSVLKFRSETKISGSGKEDDVIVEAVTGGELVTSVNTQIPHYFYMYSSVIENLNLWFPFTTFEFAILRALNVAPSQLHPNSRAFVKAYELVSLGLGLEPRLGIFFYFYYVKSLSAGKLVSLGFLVGASSGYRIAGYCLKIILVIRQGKAMSSFTAYVSACFMV
jgi:hypothetical protein